MGRRYTVGFEQVSCSAAQDVFLIKAPATMVLKLVSFRLGQSSTTTSTQQRVRVSRLTATVTNGTGGAAATPRKNEQGDPAATFTARANDTTQATTSGAKTTLFEDAFNVLSGFQYVPVPEEYYTIPPNEAIVIEFPAMGVTATYDGSVVVEEIG
jgi:hypothetical protein